MIPAFEFAAPRRVLFGRGRLRDVPGAVRSWGLRCLVFTGNNPRRAQSFLDALTRDGLRVEIISTRGEPSFDSVRQFVGTARSFKPDVIAAIGGGSVIDAAKAVAMLITNGGDPLYYAEVIGRGQPITKSLLPLLAIPTTAGAGAEATRNAVLTSRERRVKVSLRSHLMLPELVVIDPEVSRDLPPHITAATGMDALAQLVEPYVSIKANAVTDALCLAGIRRVARSLERACKNPADLDAREDMALAAWFSGMALANAGLGAAHGFAAALGGVTEAPHGLICAVMLAPVCRANVTALRVSSREHPVLGKYMDIAKILTGNESASAGDAAEWIAELAARLPLGKLSDYGVDALPADAVIDAVLNSSSMKGNPEILRREELNAMLKSVC